ncbi:MAG: 6-bladed beta-propeller [Bacteroidota bacterium]
MIPGVRKLKSGIRSEIGLLLILLMQLASCTSNAPHDNTTTLKLDLEGKGHRTPKVNIISCIPLETNDSSIYSFAVNIEFYKDRIYLLDPYGQKSLFTFNQQGTFLTRTSVGHGVGEMVDPHNFFIDKENDEVIVHDQTLRKLFIYDLDLEFKRDKSINLFVEDFAIVDGNYLVLGINGDDHAHSYNLYTDNLEDPIFVFETGFHLKDGGIGLSRPISSSKNPHLISPLNYHIYELRAGKVYPRYYLDIEKSKIISDEDQEKGLDKVFNMVMEGDKVTGPNEIAESESYISFYLNFNPSFRYLISKPTDEVLSMNPLFEDGSLPEGRIRGYAGEGDRFYLEAKAEALIKYQEETGNKLTDQDLNEESNPVFVVFEII